MARFLLGLGRSFRALGQWVGRVFRAHGPLIGGLAIAALIIVTAVVVAGLALSFAAALLALTPLGMGFATAIGLPPGAVAWVPIAALGVFLLLAAIVLTFVLPGQVRRHGEVVVARWVAAAVGVALLIGIAFRAVPWETTYTIPLGMAIAAAVLLAFARRGQLAVIAGLVALALFAVAVGSREDVRAVIGDTLHEPPRPRAEGRAVTGAAPAPVSWRQGYAAGRVAVPVVAPPSGSFSHAFRCNSAEGLCAEDFGRSLFPRGKRGMACEAVVLVHITPPRGKPDRVALASPSGDADCDAATLSQASQFHWCREGEKGACRPPEEPTWIEERFTWR